MDGVTTYSDTALEDSLVLSNYVDIASGNMRQADYGDLSASCPVAPPNQFVCMSYDIVLNTFCEDLAEAYPSS